MENYQFNTKLHLFPTHFQPLSFPVYILYIHVPQNDKMCKLKVLHSIVSTTSATATLCTGNVSYVTLLFHSLSLALPLYHLSSRNFFASSLTFANSFCLL